MAASGGGSGQISWRRITLVAVVVGLTYLGLAQYIVWLNDPVHVGASFWPAAGVTVAALLLTSRRAWWPILLAVAAAEVGGDLVHGYPAGASLLWAAGNVIEPLLAASLIRRFRPTAVRLAPLDNVLAFLLLAVLVGPIAGAAVGSLGTILWFDGSPWTVWSKYVVGDALGVLVVAPIVLHGATIRVRRSNIPEAAAYWIALGVLGALTFRDWHAAWGVVLPYFLIPMLVWAALRAGLAATALASFVLAQAANLATGLGWGPFALAGGGSGHAVTFLQIYLGIAVGTALILVAVVQDLVTRREVEMLLTHRATHDPLTGLPNRGRIYELLEEAIEQGQARGASVGVLFCDLDGFKVINDTLGHEWGDQVLVETARRLRSAARSFDIVGRIGGDEFLVVCPGLEAPADAMKVAQRLEDAMRPPIECEGRSVRIHASVGVATAEGSAGVDALVRAADLQMYQVKRQRQLLCSSGEAFGEGGGPHRRSEAVVAV